jgi:hypothetical protein
VTSCFLYLFLFNGSVGSSDNTAVSDQVNGSIGSSDNTAASDQDNQ